MTNTQHKKGPAGDAECIESDSTGRSKEYGAGRRPYSAPKVLSGEPLEAAAATCDPPAGGFGKIGPPTCGTLGS